LVVCPSGVLSLASSDHCGGNHSMVDSHSRSRMVHLRDSLLPLVVVLFCFAFAGIVWAALGLCRCSSEHRRLAWPALIAAVITFCVVGDYLLIFTGVIHLR
jgi:hypothetical protein